MTEVTTLPRGMSVTPSMSKVNFTSLLPVRKRCVKITTVTSQNVKRAKKVLAGIDGQLVHVDGQAFYNFIFPYGLQERWLDVFSYRGIRFQ